MPHKFVATVALGLALIARPTIAYADDDPARTVEQGGDEVVELTSGDRYRGALIERVVGDHVTIRLATGEIRRFSWSEVSSVGAAPASMPVRGDSGQAPLLTSPTESTPTPARGRGQRIGGVITVATGGALVVAGGVLVGLGTRNNSEDLERTCAPNCLASDLDAVRQSDTFTAVGVPLLITGAVATVVGIVLLVTAPRASKSVASGAFSMPSLATGTF